MRWPGAKCTFRSVLPSEQICGAHGREEASGVLPGMLCEEKEVEDEQSASNVTVAAGGDHFQQVCPGLFTFNGFRLPLARKLQMRPCMSNAKRGGGEGRRQSFRACSSHSEERQLNTRG